MTSSRDYGYMEDIIQFGNEVRQIAELGREVYLGDAFLARRAMERCLQNIGEAAAHLSGHVRSGYPDIPWSDIVGLRNVLAHEYGAIDYERLWDIATVDVPLLVEQLSLPGGRTA